ncbi:hypothetical protein D3C78_1138750 [compost metagenome]
MNQFRFRHVTQQTDNRLGRLTNDFLCFQRTVVGQAAGNLTTVRRHANHHLATTEAALHQFDPDRQQALVALRQRSHRTGIQHQGATGLQMTGQPLLARRQHATLRRE